MKRINTNNELDKNLISKSNLKEKIIKKINNKEKFFINIVGTNATGKTKFLESLFISKNNNDLNNIENNNTILFFKSEIIIEDEAGSGTKKTKTIADKLVEFVNDISEKITYSTEGLKQVEEIKKIIDDCSRDYNDNEDDPYFKDLNKLFKSELEKEIVKDIFTTGSVKTNDFSSGEGFYSLLKLTRNILSNSKINNLINNNIVFILDEPEKFLHPTLIKKVSYLLFDLYKNFNISIISVTHSPLFLNFTMQESIRNKSLASIYKFIRNKEKYCDDSENDYKNVIEVDINKIEELNYRERENIWNSLFSENIFLVEGLKDYEFLSVFLENIFINKYYFIIDCSGKQGVLKMYEFINNIFNINKCFLLFDCDSKENNIDKIEKFTTENGLESDEAKIKIEENKLKKSNEFKTKLLDYEFFYEFMDNLEEEIKDYKRNKHDMTYITMDNIKEMYNYELIKSKLDAYFKREK
ncbi:MAG: TOPRIM nucleotidyl transferase/hydrolase domain-containing protein [Mycoplasmoidaceae bacterium]